jgi:flagellum-specific peptidoglycan hydrolase FlgJ
MGFYENMLPYAQRVKKEIGQPVAVTLAQWTLESTAGTSQLAKTSNNLGGIKFSQYSKVAKLETRIFPSMKYARFDSLNDYTTEYIRIMNLSYYDKVRAAYKTNDLSNIVHALDASPYAEDTQYYSKVYGIINRDNLAAYDGLKTVSSGISTSSTYNSANGSLNGLQITDLEKYALIGLGVLALVAVNK